MIQIKKRLPNESSLVSALFAIGLFLPTTVEHWMRNEMIYLVIFFIPILLLLILKSNGMDKYAKINFILVNILALFFTFFSNTASNAYGMLIYYAILLFSITLFLGFTPNLKVDGFQDRKIMRTTLTICSIILILVGLGSAVLRFEPLYNIANYVYNAFYGTLLPTMLSQGKPVTVFGTHSLAGFYYFIFFTLNFSIFSKERKIMNLLISFFFLYFLVRVQSTTSFVYLLVSAIAILYFFYNNYKKYFPIIFIAFAAITLIVANKLGIFYLLKNNLFNMASSNGFGIRYRENGTIMVQIIRVLEQPFKGIGYTSVWGTYYIDCGLTHFAQRLTVLGMLSVYIGFFRLFFKAMNLKIAIAIFLIFMSFEVGFSNLFYFRTLFILPFIIQYFGYLFPKGEKATLKPF